MTWLIKLYPPAWRRRYGRELSELIATQPASFGTAIDLIAGAIDAWLNPQSSTAADAKGTKAMVPIAPVWRRLLVIRSLSPSIGLAVGRAREPRGLAQSLTGSQEIAVLYRIRTVDTTS